MHPKTYRLARLIAVSFSLLLLPNSAKADLVAYYSFNSQDGSDTSGNANNGTVGSGVQFNASTPFGGGFAFQGVPGSAGDGANGIVNVPNSPSLQGLNDQMTISLWLRADSADNGNWFRFLRKGSESNTATTQSWMLNRLSDSQDTLIRVDTQNGSGGAHNQNRGGDSAQVVLDDQWRHLVYRLDNGNWSEFIDGVETSGTYNHGTGFSNTQPLLIGGRSDANNLVGFLDDLAIWDSARSNGEMLALFNLANSELAMEAGDVNELFELHEAGAGGGSTVIGDYIFSFDDSLTGVLGSVTELPPGPIPGFAIQLSGTTGLVGLRTPEPSSLVVWTGLVILGVCVRRGYRNASRRKGTFR